MRQAVLARTGSSAHVEDLKHWCLNALCMMTSKLHPMRSQHLLLVGWLTLMHLMVIAQEAQSPLASHFVRNEGQQARLLGLTKRI
jgi:hypothetical protein